MRGLTLEKIAEACKGELFSRKGIKEEELLTEASSVVIDSRKAEAGGIFVATKGERTDGHSYIGQTLEKGVLGVICEKKPDNDDGNYIVVEDSFDAIKRLSKYYRSLFDIPVVGIIGSMGKTGTKEMAASVLSERYRILKTEGNYNNEVGVPLTIFGLRDEHELAVIEMGISDFNEMSRLADIVRPDSVIITNIGPCHLEQLRDLDGVYKAKTEVFDYLSGRGCVCLNGDDGKLRETGEVCGKKPVFYGTLRGEELDIFADHIVNRQLAGMDAVFHIREEAVIRGGDDSVQEPGLGDKAEKEERSFEVHIPLPGEHSVYNALAGCAIGTFYGLSDDEIKRGIGKVRGLKGRMEPIEAGGLLIINDCYNANPRSMENALSLLSETKGRKGRTAAILGDMFELGEDSDKLHREVGRFAAEHGIGLLYFAGGNSKSMYEEAARIKEKSGQKDSVLYFEDTEGLLSYIKEQKPFMEGDTVLVKASHAMGFERIAEYLGGL